MEGCAARAVYELGTLFGWITANHHRHYSFRHSVIDLPLARAHALARFIAVAIDALRAEIADAKTPQQYISHISHLNSIFPVFPELAKDTTEGS